MSGTVFSLKNIYFSYTDSNYALQDINLSVHHNERIAILGVNGSGKSTLLKLLDGLIFARKGRFVALDEPVDEDVLNRGEFAATFRRKVAFVFQDSDIQLFCPTVFEDLMFGPLQLGLSKEEASSRADDLLKVFDIGHLKDCSPNKLSGGEKKKVAIASSLSLNPDIILLDEPTNNLDPKTRVWLYHMLEDLAEIGKTIILSTQDLELAKIFAERAIVISEEHKIVADGAAQDILADNELLLSVNLIHEHLHYHKKTAHSHTHSHSKKHEHKDIWEINRKQKELDDE